jgi:phosphate transport system substrate-binding protein
VKKLTQKQLEDIFTGKITNWKRVGGNDRKIKVVWGLGTPGQNEVFTNAILRGKAVTADHHEATDYKSIVDYVSTTPEAIGINPQGFASTRTRNPRTPDVLSTVIAVTKGKPSPEVQKFLQYLKENAL